MISVRTEGASIANLDDRPRLRRFREHLAGIIPCDPDVRADLHKMGLHELLACYINWADRFVPPRPRRVVTWEGFLRHGSPQPHLNAVCDLAEKIDTPFLSDRIDRGYVRPKPRGIEWADNDGDKDYYLNAFETHHLHLSPKGTKELLHVSFRRDDAFLIMVGDHKSFDDGTLAQAVAEARVGTPDEFKGILGPALPRTMSQQNQLQRRGLSTAFPVGEHMVMGALLSAAGTSPLHTMYADRVIDRMVTTDPQLDAPGFGRELFERDGWAYPATPAFDWAMRYCDLYLTEATTSTEFLRVDWKR